MRVYVCVCMYVVFNVTITSISAKDVKSWLHEPLSKNKTQLLTILSLLCLPKKKNRLMGLIVVSYVPS